MALSYSYYTYYLQLLILRFLVDNSNHDSPLWESVSLARLLLVTTPKAFLLLLLLLSKSVQGSNNYLKFKTNWLTKSINKKHFFLSVTSN